MEQETMANPTNANTEALFVIETLQFGTLDYQVTPDVPGGGGSSNCNCNSNSNGASEEMLA